METQILTPRAQPNILEGHRWKGKRIGLFGGSFDPPHAGHYHVALSALNTLKLDYVWWLVSPQNPLKDRKPMTTAQRMILCHDLARHPKMIVTDIENILATHMTFETVRSLKTHFPSSEFVWITGLDNALSLHKWNSWQSLLEDIAFVHISRPPADNLVKQCPLRYKAGQTHKVITRAGRYPLEPRTTYWMMTKKMIDLSSSQIRNGEIPPHNICADPAKEVK